MTPSGDGQGKSFWSRPEGITGLVFWGIVGFVVFWFWGLIVPYVLLAAENTARLIEVCCEIAAMLWLLTSKRIHFIARSVARFITGWFVSIDPIGIRKTFIEDTEKKKSELEDSTNDIRGLRVKLLQRLQNNENLYQKSMRDLQGATSVLNSPNSSAEQKRQAQRVMALESKKSDGVGALITKQKSHAGKYDMIVTVLGRYGEVCDDTISSLKTEVMLQEQDQEESKGFLGGMRAAGAILRGMGQEKEMDDMATEALEKQYSQRMGEVEGLLDLTKDVITKADFNDAAALADVQHKLDEWSNKNSQIDMKGGVSKQQMIAAASPTFSSQVGDMVPVVDDYFK